MLALQILLCICAFLALYFFRKTFLDTTAPKLRQARISIGLFLVFTVAFFLTVYLTNYNHFYVVKILAFVTVCYYIAFADEYSNISCWITVVGIVITLVVLGWQFFSHIEHCEEPNITTSTTYILSMNDHSAVKGSVSGTTFYVSGSVDEHLVYYYYYKNEKGNIVPGNIPADLTEIIPIQNSNDPPRIVRIDETPCYTDYNCNPAEHRLQTAFTTTRYELYVPESATPKEFTLDLD